MSLWDELKDIANNIKDALEEKDESIHNKNWSLSKSQGSNISNSKLPVFPKFELIETKGNIQATNKFPKTIEDYEKKYILKNLQPKIDRMSDREKAYVYYFLAYKHSKIRAILGSKIEESELAINLFDNALKLYPDNIDFAYEYFNFCSRDDLVFTKEKIVDVCELCIKLSNNKDIRNKFSYIYYLLGKYYNLEKNDYSKSIEYYKKALEYSKDPMEDRLYIYRDMAYVYKQLGDYKTSLDTCNLILKTKHGYFDIPELKSEMENYTRNHVTKAQVDRKNHISNMHYYFKRSVGKYPEEVLLEAYDHYLNAQELIYKGKRSLAIKEYEYIKKVLPEESKSMDDLIAIHISIGISQNEEGMDKEKEFDSLYASLKVALESGNIKEICRIYNSLGVAYSNNKNYEKALEFYTKAIENSPSPFLYYSNLALCYEEMGRYDDAIAIYYKLKKEAPDYDSHFKPDYNIERINDIKSGKIGKNGEEYYLAIEHLNKGDEAFNNSNVIKALSEYNTAFGINENSSQVLCKILLCLNIYDSHYSDEQEKGFQAIKLCERNNCFNYLPFIYTLYGDSISYQAWGQGNQAKEYYEMAVFLLDMIPANERFAAPYYKLGLLHEKEKNFKEALKLFEQAKIINETYNIEKDIQRVKIQLEDNGKSNKENADKHIKQMKKYYESKLYKMVIEEGKKALDYSPNNIESYCLISKAAEELSLLFEQKWASKEGLRLDLDDYNESNLYNDLMFSLGRCCKHENKYDQAKIYFEVLVENDEFGTEGIKDKALEELYSLSSS